MPKISVIVPMYKVEAYLPMCVASIREQSLEDIEIILVDDESPDNCGEMAEDYARVDERIRVVHQPNGGLGPARNAGLEVASGEFVSFVDSDDWIEPDMCERLYETALATNAEIVYTGMKTVVCGETGQLYEQPYAGRTFVGPSEIYEFRRSFFGSAPSRVKIDPVTVSACVAIYNRDLIERYGLRFTNVQSEDSIFNTTICRKATRIACISGTPYCYRKDGQASITCTKTFSPKRAEAIYEFLDKLSCLADEEPAEFWDDSHLRVNRCVIDTFRCLMREIEFSDADTQTKQRYAKEICNKGILINACKGYPFSKLPLMQMIFGLCLRFKLAGACRFLISMKG